MLGLIKLLYSLSASVPALRELVLDLISMLRAFQSQRRKDAKDEAVDIAIDDVFKRMRDAQARQRKKADRKE